VSSTEGLTAASVDFWASLGHVIEAIPDSSDSAVITVKLPINHRHLA